jgi:hypothetical protein
LASIEGHALIEMLWWKSRRQSKGEQHTTTTHHKLLSPGTSIFRPSANLLPKVLLAAPVL